MEQPKHDFLTLLRNERRDLLNRLRETRFSTLKPGYSHAQVIPYASYAPWLDDKDFMELFNKIENSHTLVDIYRCYDLYALARQVAHVPGEIVEIGVWRGGTAAIVASVASATVSNKTIYLFDTFSGVAKASQTHDTFYTGGEHADTDIGIVQRLMHDLNLRHEICVGIFPDATIEALPPQISFAHIDVDTYGSARDAFLAIWPRISLHGAIVFDDYGFFGCEGVTEAVQELLRTTKGIFFVHNLNGHAVLIKIVE